MKTIIVSLILLSGLSAFSTEERCKINLWKEKSTSTEILKLILKDKGYDTVLKFSAEISLNVTQAGFAEKGCDDGGIFGSKNFKRVNAYAELRNKKNEVIDSVYGSDIQTESTNFNNPLKKRVVCATLDAAWLNAASKIPHCYELKEMLKGQ